MHTDGFLPFVLGGIAAAFSILGIVFLGWFFVSRPRYKRGRRGPGSSF